MDNLKTGDLLLFTGHTTGPIKYLSWLIKWGTHSNYTHVAMILKDPTYFGENLKGLYVWESSWEGTPDPQDGKIKLGVQITPLDDILKSFKGAKIIFRSVKCDSTHFTEDKLKAIHKVVYDKPYDIVPKDWIEAFIQKDPNPQKTSRFWCSALIGYIYAKCGIITEMTDWSILKPSDFSLDGENLSFVNDCGLSNIDIKIN